VSLQTKRLCASSGVQLSLLLLNCFLLLLNCFLLHAQLLNGATQKDPICYCIEWDLDVPADRRLCPLSALCCC
jgi:hypothetical protein